MSGLLPWHRPLWERLQGLLQAQRLPHALLFCGVRGMGKNHFALLFAHALLCESPAPGGLPCGACRGCRLAQAGNHPDLHRCAPEDDKVSISIDQIREIGQFLALKSHAGGRKVVIIAPAEQMNLSAANSLLKMLEEPPTGTHLVLVSSRPAALPATVRSRCQRLVFAPAEGEAASEWLSARLGGADDPGVLLATTQGAPLAALEIAEQGQLERRREMLSELVSIAQRRGDPLQVAEKWLKFGAKESLYCLYGWLVDLIRLRVTDRPPCLSNPDNMEALLRLSSGQQTMCLLERLDLASQSLRMLESSVNAQLLLEDNLLLWAPETT